MINKCYKILHKVKFKIKTICFYLYEETTDLFSSQHKVLIVDDNDYIEDSNPSIYTYDTKLSGLDDLAFASFSHNEEIKTTAEFNQ